MSDGNSIKVVLVRAAVSVAVTTISSWLFLRVLRHVSKFLDPSSAEMEAAKEKANTLLQSLGIDPSQSNLKLSDYEYFIAASLLENERVAVSWENIGGLDDIITDIRHQVIVPFMISQKMSENKSALFRAPRGVLLYGPPGCGKTLLAKAIARNTNARFIHLQASTLLDKFVGETEKRAQAIFSLAHKLQPTILFIDEADALFSSRNSRDPNESMRILKTQFMTLWDGLETNQEGKVLVIGATNRPNDLDKAILRRFSCRFEISLPNDVQRLRILKILLSDHDTSASIDLVKIAHDTRDFSGSDLHEMCRLAVLRTAESAFKDMDTKASQKSNSLSSIVSVPDGEINVDFELRPLTMDDLESSVKLFQKRRRFLPGSSSRGGIAARSSSIEDIF